MKMKRLIKSFNTFITSFLFNIKVIIRHISFNWIYKGMLALRPYHRLTRMKSSRLKKSFKAKLGILSAKIKGIKRPRWFQWNIFPKDGNPPTQSLFEITIYIVVLVICFKIFVCFNRIPQNYLTFEVEKIPYIDDNPQKNNLVQYITKSIYDDTNYYLHYQIANINYKIPMQNVKNDSIKMGVWWGNVYDDSMKVICTLDNYRIKPETYLNSYWQVVFSQADGEYKQIKENSNSDQYYNKELKSIFYKYTNLPRFYERLRGDSIFILDSLAYYSPYRYYYKTGSSLLKNPFFNKLVVKDSNWLKSDSQIIKASNEYGRTILKKIGLETKNDENYVTNEILTFCDKPSNLEGLRYELDEEYSEEYFHDVFPNKDYFKISNYTSSESFRYLSTELPGWFDFFDISQASYLIKLKATSIDSINLVIDFVGATDFYTTSIEPDEINGHSMKFTDQKKILQIKKEGLSFYAKFKELENMQMIRTFAITAIISGLVIIILTFFILGLYRSLKVLFGGLKV